MTNIRLARFLTSSFATMFCMVLFGCGDSTNGAGNITSIDVSPISATIQLGGTLQYKATAHFSHQPDKDFTSDAKWSSSVPGVATLPSNSDPLDFPSGFVTSVSAGKTMIAASLGGVTGSTDLGRLPAVRLPRLTTRVQRR
jgi:hypothetical protein